MLTEMQVLEIIGSQHSGKSAMVREFVAFMTTNQPEDHSGSCDFQSDPSGYVLFAWRAFQAGWKEGIEEHPMTKHRMSDFELAGIRKLVEEHGTEDDLMTEIAERLIVEVDRLRELEAGSMQVVNTSPRVCPVE